MQFKKATDYIITDNKQIRMSEKYLMQEHVISRGKYLYNTHIPG